MKRIGIITCGLLAAALLAGPAAQAQELSGRGGHLCVDVRVGTESTGYLDCLNAELRGVVEQQKGRQMVQDLAVQQSLSGTPNQVGLFNEAAVSERLGNSFGHSVIPQRPPPPAYPPLVPR